MYADGRYVCKATYFKHRPKKGFKGYWTSSYVFKNLTDQLGNVILDSFTLGNVKCIKGKRLKCGDIIQLRVTLTNKSKGIEVSRPGDVILIGHDSSFD